jgi:hypothetical protein
LIMLDLHTIFIAARIGFEWILLALIQLRL